MAHQFDCPQAGCNFMVRANDEQEVIDVVTEHARNKHDTTMPEADIRSGMEQV